MTKEDKLIRLMCRAATKYTIHGPDVLIYASMEDCASGIQTKLWETRKYEMTLALAALKKAGYINDSHQNK